MFKHDNFSPFIKVKILYGKYFVKKSDAPMVLSKNVCLPNGLGEKIPLPNKINPTLPSPTPQQ